MFTMPRALPRQVTSPVVTVLARLGVTPNMLTFAQLLGGIGAGALVAGGYFLWGGIAMLAAATLDAIDGTLARTTGKATRFGGIFDSVTDRLFEGAVFGGILFHYLQVGHKEESLLAFVAIVGSLSVSYVRARAEAEGVQVYDGLFTRGVRLILLAIGLVAGHVLGVSWLRVVLWVMAVMTVATALHRLLAVWLKLRAEENTGKRGP